MDSNEGRFEEGAGPVIASGAHDGIEWALQGAISDDRVSTFVSTQFGGGGGTGSLPFADTPDGKLGHFGSVGWGISTQGRGGLGGKRVVASHVCGVVSPDVADVQVWFEDDTTIQAVLIDTGDSRAKFFVAVWFPSSGCHKLVAIDSRGTWLEDKVRLDGHWR